MLRITISGQIGSGKSTVAEILEDKLGIRYVYSGKIFRNLAKKYNMNLEEFGKYCEKNSEVDKELDQKQLEILKEGNLILEGRLAGWLAYKNDIPALKIAILADIDTRTKRIIKREEGSIKKRKEEIIKREKSESKRYKNYYNIDINDNSIYDIVIDSSNKSPEEIVNMIIAKLDR